MEQLDTHPCDREGGAGRHLLSGNLPMREQKGRKRGRQFFKKKEETETLNESRKGNRGGEQCRGREGEIDLTCSHTVKRPAELTARIMSLREFWEL